VRGHTSGEGGAVASLRLGRQRAVAARDYLAQRGLPKRVMPAQGVGEAFPNDSGSARRADVVVEFGGKCAEEQ